MNIITLTNNAKFFTLNGVKYIRKYQAIARGKDNITINNIFDTNYQILSSTKYDDVEVNGTVYTNQDDLLTALLSVLFNTSSSDILTELEESGFTDNSDKWNTAYNKKVNNVSITGDNNKILTITQQDGSTLTTAFTDINNAPSGDEYINSLNWSSATGVLTVGRTGGLSNITTNLDGRYSQTDTNTTYTPGDGLSLTGTTFNINDPFNPSGTYGSLRAQGTTKADVGLDLVQNRRFNWVFGSSTPSHIWGSQGSSNEHYVYNATQMKDFLNISSGDVSGVVTLGTNQTITGAKTFTSSSGIKIQSQYPQIKFNNGTDDRLLYRSGNDLYYRYDGTNNGKLWHSGNLNSDNIVYRSVAQTITGSKTFSGTTRFVDNAQLRIGSSGNGTLKFQSTGNDTLADMEGDLIFRDGSSSFINRMRLTNEGNLGIGNIFPSEKLEVNGNIKATKFYQSSLRSLKTNINTYKEDALSLVNDLDIVGFDYKKGGKDNIGIIADDSESVFLSEEKTSVNLYNTIFIQAKAIQELSKKNEDLQEQINEINKRI